MSAIRWGLLELRFETRLRRTAFHPVLVGTAPALNLFSNNLGLVPVGDGLLGVFGCLVLAMAVWGGVNLILREARRSALLASFSLLLFYSYGPAHRYVFDNQSTVLLHSLLLAASFSLLVVAVWAVSKLPGELLRITLILNVSTIVVAGVPICVAIAGAGQSALESQWAMDSEVEVDGNGSLPDIYYIIPDGYGRTDVLSDVFDYENREFIEALETKGFHVDPKSFSNYGSTYLSLASSMSFAYLQDLQVMANQIGSKSQSLAPLRELIAFSRLGWMLRNLGYRLITFPTGYSATGFVDADIVIEGRWTPSEFQDALIAMTPVPGLLEVFFESSHYDLHRARIENTLGNLDQYAGELNAPIFVLAHLFSPHPPFVFNADGSPTSNRGFTTADGTHYFTNGGTRAEYKIGYPAQVSFISRSLDAAIDRVLAKSRTPPIIIIQSDHGPGINMDHESLERTVVRERFGILNAYYLPGFDYRQLPSGISPVNTFRVVLNHYFGTDLELLENRAYFSRWSRPYILQEITDKVQ